MNVENVFRREQFPANDAGLPTLGLDVAVVFVVVVDFDVVA